MLRSQWISLLKLLIAMVIVICIMTGAYFLFAAQAKEHVKQTKYLLNPHLGDDSIGIIAKVQSVDFLNTIVKVHFDFIPSGKYVNMDGISLATPLTIWVDNNQYDVAQNASMKSLTISVNFLDNSAMYPLDVNEIFLQVAIHQAKKIIPSVLTLEVRNPILTLELIPADEIAKDAFDLPDFATIAQMNADSDYILILACTRSATAKVFSFLIIILMWIMTVADLGVSYELVRSSEVPAAPILAFHASVLFALPALRNSQPSIPSAIGVLSDVLSFYWAMSFASLAFIIAVSCFVIRMDNMAVGARQARGANHA